MSKLILDCSCGARKNSIANQLFNMLSEEDAERFVASFNNAGLKDASIFVCSKTPHRELLVKCNGLQEFEVEKPGHEHHSSKLHP